MKKNKLFIIGAAVLAVIIMSLFSGCESILNDLNDLLADGSSSADSSVTEQINSDSGASGDVESSSAYQESIPSESSDEKSLPESESASSDTSPESVVSQLRFRNKNLLNQHYEKHGIDMGFSSAEEYEQAAAQVPYNPEVLHKLEAEDGDDVYYIERTNEFVIVSTDGYIRTYFWPDRGIDYFNRQ